jgi:hypothetical protein
MHFLSHFHRQASPRESAVKRSRDTERSGEPRREICFINRFLHFGPLYGPPVEMTKAHILIIITIIMSLRIEDVCLDADWLSLDYLIAEGMWDPAIKNRHSVKLNRCATI